MSGAADVEAQLRIELMAVQIDKGRLDIERVRQEMKWEVPKALAAILGAAAAIAGIILALWHFAPLPH